MFTATRVIGKEYWEEGMCLVDRRLTEYCWAISETHPDPDKAKCDGPCALKLSELDAFLEKIFALKKISQRTIMKIKKIDSLKF